MDIVEDKSPFILHSRYSDNQIADDLAVQWTSHAIDLVWP